MLHGASVFIEEVWKENRPILFKRTKNGDLLFENISATTSVSVNELTRRRKAYRTACERSSREQAAVRPRNKAKLPALFHVRLCS